MLHPQAVAALEAWAQGPSVSDPGYGAAEIERQRNEARAAAVQEPREPVAASYDVDAGGVRCRLLLPSGESPRGTVVLLHGGGFVFGDLDTHDAQARRVANRSGLAVLAVGYRRPPEHRFPAAPDDVDRSLDWLRETGASLGAPTGRLAVLGDSAGGNLALVGALRHPGLFAAAVLVYPFLDPELAAPSYRAHDNGGLTGEEAAWFWQQYAARPEDFSDPDLAPLLSPGLGGLPPTLVQCAEHDVLVGEDQELARRIAAGGGTVAVTTYPGMVHGFWRHPELFDAAEPALLEAAEFLRLHV